MARERNSAWVAGQATKLEKTTECAADPCFSKQLIALVRFHWGDRSMGLPEGVVPEIDEGEGIDPPSFQE
jgi:hypothetical protein